MHPRLIRDGIFILSSLLPTYIPCSTNVPTQTAANRHHTMQRYSLVPDLHFPPLAFDPSAPQPSLFFRFPSLLFPIRRLVWRSCIDIIPQAASPSHTYLSVSDVLYFSSIFSKSTLSSVIKLETKCLFSSLIYPAVLSLSAFLWLAHLAFLPPFQANY